MRKFFMKPNFVANAFGLSKILHLVRLSAKVFHLARNMPLSFDLVELGCVRAQFSFNLFYFSPYQIIKTKLRARIVAYKYPKKHQVSLQGNVKHKKVT